MLKYGAADVISAHQIAISQPPAPPRKRGRPKGYPKSGGRTKQSPKSWTAPEIRDALIGKSDAIDVLADIVAGRPLLCGTERASSETGPGSPVWRYPSLSQRLKGLEILLAKVVPDLRAVEQTVDATIHDGGETPHDPRQTARALFAILREADDSGGLSALDHLDPHRSGDTS